ncbi:uncharacterized protein F4812DRAFT_353166 [Daldinia caldariorum]|uniref:uncharacterized protein n=1 Tax=Daldinia caldariorum TaxID=326644 RepID=UPI0020087D11|nr:uncharacterized protein F4812DRAFT_353166 [Daldinia caldariorum]KAI1468970.1 hypothetical protein F4812DRAFT_353166 [Daldinia caldariorum]
MFDPHWQELPRKRQREDEEQYSGIQISAGDGMNGTLGFTEHRNKRLQSLPLRTSPTQKRRSGLPGFPVAVPTAATTPPSSITPTDSDSEDMRNQQQSDPSMDVDRDLDMMMDSSSEPFQPGPSQADSVNASITGRLPTPIHCTFAAQVRGQSWGTMNQTVHMTNRSNDDAMVPDSEADFARAKPFPTRQDESSVPRYAGAAVEWSMVQNRRLPSPISESGGEDMPASPGMVLDSTASQPQRPCLPHMPHSINPHAMAIHPNIQTIPQTAENDAGMMDTDPASSPSSAPATPSPRGKFGHSRSKHTLNNWTLQPGMKKSFSIGYRADCEKCRMKIPGHFNHIIIS